MANSRQVLADRIVFGECQKQHSLPNLLTADAPTMINARDGKRQTPPTAPVVQINDLTKTHGNQVNVSVIHDLSEAPQVGLEDRDGYEEDITTSNFKMIIDQIHKSVKVDLGIEQQKVGYNKKKLGRPLLTKYHGKFNDECAVAHLAGARGTYMSSDRILPVAGTALNKMLVNPLTAPTYDRKFYCGDATGISSGTAITATDTFGPADTRKFKQKIELMPHPIQPVRLAAGTSDSGTDPMYIGFVTPKMWSTFEASSTDFQKNIANALTRTKGFNHPLFQGEMFMKDNILFKKYLQPIGWQPAEAISVTGDNDAATESNETVPSGVIVERGIILGGQALALAYGSVLPGGMGNFKMNGEIFQQDSQWRQWMDWIAGLAKIRFEDNEGRMNDYGVCAFDGSVTGV